MKGTGGEVEHQSPRQMMLVITALLVMTVLPIGIHTVLLDDLGVPYPAALPRTGWPTIPDHALLIFGLIGFESVLRLHDYYGSVRRWIYLFLIVGAMNQALLRLPIMRNVVSTKWTIYPFIDNLPAVLWYGAAVTLAMFSVRLTTTTLHKVIAAAGLAGFLDIVVAPAMTATFAPVIAADELREGNQLYTVPYDWHVDVPSYLTYVEPALAAFIAALVLRRLQMPTAMIVALLFALQSGPLFRVALNVCYAPDHPLTAIISEGQFALEALALAALSASFAVAIVGKPARPVTYTV